MELRNTAWDPLGASPTGFTGPDIAHLSRVIVQGASQTDEVPAAK